MRDFFFRQPKCFKKERNGFIKEVNATSVYLDFGLDFTQFPPGEHLNVRTDLFPRPRLARPQFDVTCNQLVATCLVKKKSNTLHNSFHFVSSPPSFMY